MHEIELRNLTSIGEKRPEGAEFDSAYGRRSEKDLSTDSRFFHVRSARSIAGYGRRNVNFTAGQCPLARLIRDGDVGTGIRHQLACRVPDI